MTTNHPSATGGAAWTRPPLSVLHECFELLPDGTLIWKARPASHFIKAGNAARLNRERAGLPAGHVGKDGYLLVGLSFRGRAWRLPAHHIVWAMSRGVWSTGELDHADNDRSNNHPDNLRPAQRWQNMGNMRAHKDNALGLKGVIFDRRRGKYLAQICHHRKKIRIGWFDSPGEAHAAYTAKARALRGEFARA